MGYFKRFVEWQNYAHYFLLTIGLFAVHELTSMLGIETWAVLHYVYGYITLFFIYFVAFILIDSIIHGFFWILPKKFGGWRD